MKITSRMFLLVSAVLFNHVLHSLACIPPSFQSLTVQSNFLLSRFLEVWFEVKWLPNERHNESDIWRNFYQSFQLVDSTSQRLAAPVTARVLNNDTCFTTRPWSIIANNGAKMILESQGSSIIRNQPYYILETDYDHYALVYACQSINYTLTESCERRVLWLFLREVSFTNEYINRFDNYIQSNLCINLTDLEITPQDGKSCYSSSSSTIRHEHLLLYVFFFLLYI